MNDYSSNLSLNIANKGPLTDGKTIDDILCRYDGHNSIQERRQTAKYPSPSKSVNVQRVETVKQSVVVKSEIWTLNLNLTLQTKVDRSTKL